MLKKGLKALRKQDDTQKLKIQADLDAQKRITESDEEWLDGEGNLVDEERVIDQLENASDYDEGFAGLREARKLEGIIDTFGQQTRLIEAQALKSTEITDYFTRI